MARRFKAHFVPRTLLTADMTHFSLSFRLNYDESHRQEPLKRFNWIGKFRASFGASCEKLSNREMSIATMKLRFEEHQMETLLSILPQKNILFKLTRITPKCVDPSEFISAFVAQHPSGIEMRRNSSERLALPNRFSSLYNWPFFVKNKAAQRPLCRTKRINWFTRFENYAFWSDNLIAENKYLLTQLKNSISHEFPASLLEYNGGIHAFQ